ncbi:hypothetical protein ERUR111494_01165 [Erysipelothrix urinaevulpis]|uniref:hypothetical protein n=1 Tax=Erysipelothrix urinaevulpis TaxID=2683717 RepID=UPI00135CF0E8|nr:hypothetical protein [Erysipelothrix urinaevulpis]
MKEILRLEKEKWRYRIAQGSLFILFVGITLFLQRWMETMQRGIIQQVIYYVVLLIVSSLYVYGMRKIRTIFKGNSCKFQ